MTSRGFTDSPLPLAPDGLPILSAGKHAVPTEGACFMEFASVLAGEPFTDHPHCTHPLLAQLARRVNDNVDDTTRQHMVPLVPDVVGLRGGMAVTAAIVVEVTVEALAVQPGSRRLHRACQRARRRATAKGLPRLWARLSEPMYRTGASTRAVICAVEAVHQSEPAALRGLLAGAIEAARGIHGTSSPPTGTENNPTPPSGRRDRTHR